MAAVLFILVAGTAGLARYRFGRAQQEANVQRLALLATKERAENQTQRLAYRTGAGSQGTLRSRGKTVLDIPSYRSGDYTF